MAELVASPRRWVLPLAICMPKPSLSSGIESTALTFVLAPLPNAVFAHCGSDEFGSSYESSPAVDFGRFLTSLIVVTGFAMPIVLAHSGVINGKACAMSIAGGG